MSRQSPPPTSKIFVSYRRQDASGHAGRLHDELKRVFGEGRIFIDIDSIQGGDNFKKVIEDAVGSSAVLLVIIGQQWLTSSPGAARRLDNENDFVRLEIEAALKREVRVIPVLVEGATLPSPQELPASLIPLTERHAVELSDLRWSFDVGRLMETLKQFLPHQNEPVPEPRLNYPLASTATLKKHGPWLLIVAAVLIAALALLIAFKTLNSGDNTNNSNNINAYAQTTPTPPAGNANVTVVNPSPVAAPSVSPQSSPSPVAVPSVEKTTWIYKRGGTTYIIDFIANGVFRYTNDKGKSFTGTWKQDGDKIYLEFSGGEQKEGGIIKDNKMNGSGVGSIGSEYEWSATKSNY